jgi:hypothetical protein
MAEDGAPSASEEVPKERHLIRAWMVVALMVRDMMNVEMNLV